MSYLFILLHLLIMDMDRIQFPLRGEERWRIEETRRGKEKRSEEGKRERRNGKERNGEERKNVKVGKGRERRW